MLNVNHISKKLGNFSLQSVSFRVNMGEYFILLGPSGAGKTIILEMIAGLIQPDSGNIEFKGSDITHLPIQKRNIGLVFQTFELFPHLTVKQNISFSLRSKRLTKIEQNRRVLDLAQRFGITHLLRQNASELSGGERQRVALARTLATAPELLLLDEPLSALDAERRTEVRSLLRELNRNGQTIIHVTHDFEEAIALAHTVAVLGKGVIEQLGTPEEVFNRPTSNFVARMVGVRNFFPAALTHSNETNLMIARIKGNLTFYLYSEKSGNGFILFSDNAVSISDSPPASSALNNFKGTITDIYPQRFGREVVVDIGIKIVANITNESLQRLRLVIGKTVWISIKSGGIQFIPV